MVVVRSTSWHIWYCLVSPRMTCEDKLLIGTICKIRIRTVVCCLDDSETPECHPGTPRAKNIYDKIKLFTKTHTNHLSLWILLAPFVPDSNPRYIYDTAPHPFFQEIIYSSTKAGRGG